MIDPVTLAVLNGRLEQIAETNTEGRIRMEVELGGLRNGQEDIKRMINARDKRAGGRSD